MRSPLTRLNSKADRGNSRRPFGRHLPKLRSRNVTLVGNYEKAMQHRLCKNEQTSKYKKECSGKGAVRRADFAQRQSTIVGGALSAAKATQQSAKLALVWVSAYTAYL